MHKLDDAVLGYKVCPAVGGVASANYQFSKLILLEIFKFFKKNQNIQNNLIFMKTR